MQLIILFISVYAFIIFAKLAFGFSINWIFIEDTKIDRSFVRKYLFIPFATTFLKKIRKKARFYIFISEALGSVTGFIFAYHIINLINQNIEGIYVYILVYSIFTILLLCLSIYEIVFQSLPDQFVMLFLLSSLVCNIIAGALNVFGRFFVSTRLTNFGILGTLDNLAAGVLIFGIVFLIKRFVKNSGLKDPDLQVASAIGFILGIQNSTLCFILALILASFASVLYLFLFKKKPKNFLIPISPILLLSFVFTLSFGSEILKLIIV